MTNATRRSENRSSLIQIATPLTFVLPVLPLTFLYYVSPFSVSWIQMVLAYGLVLLPILTYRYWQVRQDEIVPFLAVILGIYALYFVLPLFLQYRYVGQTPVSDTGITKALTMAFIGEVTLIAASGIVLGLVRGRSSLPEITWTDRSRMYLRGLVLLGIVAPLFPATNYVFGSSMRQVVIDATSFVPSLAFALLLRRALRGHASKWDSVILLLFAVTHILAGLSSGWLGAGLGFVVIAIFTFMSERGRPPLLPILLVVPFIIFFQQGKTAYRATHWESGSQASVSTDPLGGSIAWAQISWNTWSSEISSPVQAFSIPLLQPTVSRVSLLMEAGNIFDDTPSVIPFQNGATYQNLLFELIPRAILPNKPSVNLASQMYQILYGRSDAADLASTSIAVGVPAEGYMNFGWLGVLLSMAFVGMIFGVIRGALLRPSAGTTYTTLGIVVLAQFIPIEGEMAQYVGGVLQQILVAVVLLLPVMRRGPAPGHDGLPSLQSSPEPRQARLPVRPPSRLPASQ